MEWRCFPLFLALILLLPTTISAAEEESQITLEAWHSFAAESQEEAAFLDAISQFESSHSHIDVEVTGVPFGDIDQLYLTAAQGGEAPDIVRLSSDQLGEIGEVRVDGYPLLEDLPPGSLHTFGTALNDARYQPKH